MYSNEIRKLIQIHFIRTGQKRAQYFFKDDEIRRIAIETSNQFHKIYRLNKDFCTKNYSTLAAKARAVLTAHGEKFSENLSDTLDRVSFTKLGPISPVNWNCKISKPKNARFIVFLLMFISIVGPKEYVPLKKVTKIPVLQGGPKKPFIFCRKFFHDFSHIFRTILNFA